MLLLVFFLVTKFAPSLGTPELQAQDSSSSNFVRRFFHGSFILDKALYIDGGEWTWQNGSSVAQQVLNQTLVISLDQSFSTSTSTLIPDVIDKGLCPNFNQVRFWYDRDYASVYAYGGEFSQLNSWNGPGTVPLNGLWQFVPLDPGPGGSWQEVNTVKIAGWQQLNRPSGGAVASSNGVGYNIGGYYDTFTDQDDAGLGEGYIPAPGLQFCNFTESTCTNNSATGFVSDGTFEFGGLVQVPTWGVHGLVVVLGGQTSPNLSSFTDGEKYQDMANISVFEPVSQRWYYQTAIGQIPTPRDRFCVVGVNATNRTFEIFLYGGQYGSGIFDTSGSPTNAGSDEVFILSLPSFSWFQANYTSSDPRVLHTCHAIGKQMLSIGGINPSAGSFQDAIGTADNYTEGIKIFDMTNLEWTNRWNDSFPEYQVPAIVNEFYSANGYSPVTWDMPELQAIFNGTASYGNSNGSQPSSSSSQISKTGAIAGGVVGGVVGLALALGLAYYLKFGKNSKTKPDGEVELVSGLEVASAEEKRDAAELAVEGNTRQEVESPPGELPTQKEHPGWEMPAKEEPARGEGLPELP